MLQVWAADCSDPGESRGELRAARAPTGARPGDERRARRADGAGTRSEQVRPCTVRHCLRAVQRHALRFKVKIWECGARLAGESPLIWGVSPKMVEYLSYFQWNQQNTLACKNAVDTERNHAGLEGLRWTLFPGKAVNGGVMMVGCGVVIPSQDNWEKVFVLCVASCRRQSTTLRVPGLQTEAALCVCLSEVHRGPAVHRQQLHRTTAKITSVQESREDRLQQLQEGDRSEASVPEQNLEHWLLREETLPSPGERRQKLASNFGAFQPRFEWRRPVRNS